MMLNSIDQLTLSSKASGVSTAKSDILAALTKLKFNVDESERWLNGVGTLMIRQTELGIVSREEVEQAMERHNLDDNKVIRLFQEVAELQAKRSTIGNATRDDIKAMLALAWEEENRVNLTEACLTCYCELMADEANLLVLFGQHPTPDDCHYLRVSVLRFKGETEPCQEYLKKISEILGKGESLGNPSREYVVEQLDIAKGDKRKAASAIREEYHRVRDIQLKEEYAKKQEASKKALMSADAPVPPTPAGKK